ncbi:MAG: sigma-70 family RNA polymerase sigma factor [Solirubrobacteraceae bacterium]
MSQIAVEQAPEGARLTVARADALVLQLVADHADSLLRVARRYSLCADDAHDAYQRGMEILLRHARRLDPDRASGWIHTVVKHEALTINQARRRIVGSEEVDLDALETSTVASPEEHAESAERIARTAEALHSLKPQEVRAIWLKALGHSYEQIAESTGWTYTKVNRCLAEGRKSFLARYAGIEAGEECVRLAPAVSAFVDGEAGARAVIEVRNHLRACAGCRAVVRGLHETAEPLSVVLPAATLATVTSASPPGSGFFSRVYETLAMTANERAANAMLRAQAVVDTVASGKMAVAAASVAAVAGGGAAVQGAIRADERPAAIIHRAQVAQLATEPAAAPARHATRKPKRVVRRRPPRRRVVTHRTPTATSTQGPTQTQPQQATAPSPSPSPATTNAAPAQQPVTKAASSSSGGGSAAGEFGFEGP